ncbi:hypothetical protein AB3K92_35435 [Burkholderia sp. Bmkn7]|uniref:hypothetical protein n=1 Tax=Burkholderia sp. Bmkn7 TaxID=3236841 RepID=UPI0034E5B8A7
MLWPAEGTLENPGLFAEFDVVDVLDEDDGPTLFTARAGSETYLLYTSAIDPKDRIVRYIAVHCNTDMVASLLQGRLPLREALTQDRVWAIDHSFDGKHTSSVQLKRGLDGVPEQHKPVAGARLLADHHYAT